ncbi:MAG: type II toxin-antitoxin system HicB family antitoxin [Clostridia bacterium]|nr:type II toxin-antitoxin system HicB family antitoxin [Clostridia bacterium]
MKYAFTVNLMQVEDHVFWVAASSALEGCVGQGETAEEAIRELEINENEWIETAKKYDIPVPEVHAQKAQEYSGKFTVRTARSTHRIAAERAKSNGVSLNQYVNDAIVAANARPL